MPDNELLRIFQQALRHEHPDLIGSTSGWVPMDGPLDTNKPAADSRLAQRAADTPATDQPGNQQLAPLVLPWSSQQFEGCTCHCPIYWDCHQHHQHAFTHSQKHAGSADGGDGLDSDIHLQVSCCCNARCCPASLQSLCHAPCAFKGH